MALIEKETNHYYRVNQDLSKIQGFQVFVNYSVYESQAHRLKEKQREKEWATFFRKLREDLEVSHGELLTEIEKVGLEPTEILEADNGFIDRELHPKLREIQDAETELISLERQIGDGLFRTGDLPCCCIATTPEMSERLTLLGFDEQWLSDPVRIIAGGEVNTGEYKGEQISAELFYNRLKSVLGETIEEGDE